MLSSSDTALRTREATVRHADLSSVQESCTPLFFFPSLPLFIITPINQSMTDRSHATGDSAVVCALLYSFPVDILSLSQPGRVQEKLPTGAEHAAPESGAS